MYFIGVGVGILPLPPTFSEGGALPPPPPTFAVDIMKQSSSDFHMFQRNFFSLPFNWLSKLEEVLASALCAGEDIRTLPLSVTFSHACSLN